MAFTAKIADIIAADKTGLLACHASWQRVPLSEVASILNGAPFDAALFNAASGTPLARIRDVVGGTTSTYYTGDFDEAYLLEQGDLLIGMDGDFNMGYWGARRALLNQRVCKLSVNQDHYDKKFLGFALPGYLAAINANTPSITVKHLSSRTVGEIELPLPPRAEQTRIVEKLEELLGNLDAAVADLQAAQRKLARYRQSLLKAAVEGTLTAQWRTARTSSLSFPRRRESSFSGVPAEQELDAQTQGLRKDARLRGNDGKSETGPQLLQRILQERRARWEDKQRAKFEQTGKTPPKGWQAKYPEPVAPDTTDLPALPEGWVWASLDALVADSSYGTSAKCGYGNNGTPVLRIPNVSGGDLDLRDMKFSDGPLPLTAEDFLDIGDVLVIRTNGSIGLVGRAAAVTAPLPAPHYFASYLLRLRCVNRTVLHHWVSTFLASPVGRRWIEERAASSAGQHNISLSALLTMPVPLPAQVEQTQILAILDAQLSAAKEQDAALARALHQAAAQRRNLLTAAFAGQLVPQDPADEPASALLARIRASKADNALEGKRKPKVGRRR